MQWLRLLWTTGVWVSAVVTHRLSCSEACGIFLDQGSNPCPPPLASDSNPLYHQGSPRVSYTMRKLYLIRAFSKSPPPMQHFPFIPDFIQAPYNDSTLGCAHVFSVLVLKRKNSVPSRGLDKGVFTVQLRRSILGTTEQWATLDKSKTTRSFWLIQCQVLIAVYPFILPPLCSQDPDFFQAAIGHVLQGMSYPLECPLAQSGLV